MLKDFESEKILQNSSEVGDDAVLGDSVNVVEKKSLPKQWCFYWILLGHPLLTTAEATVTEPLKEQRIWNE